MMEEIAKFVSNLPFYRRIYMLSLAQRFSINEHQCEENNFFFFISPFYTLGKSSNRSPRILKILTKVRKLQK